MFLGHMNYGTKKIPVAVKSCKTIVGEDQREEFMKEAKVPRSPDWRRREGEWECR